MNPSEFPYGPDPGEPTLDLLRRAKEGDQQAWLAIDERYREALVRIVHGSRALLGGMRRRLDTDDLIQSTLIAAFRGLDGFEYRGSGSFQSFLQRVLRNRIRHQLRLHLAERRDVRRHASPEALAEHTDLSQCSPGEAVLKAEKTILLLEAVGELPDRDLRIMLGMHLEGRSAETLGDELGLSASTVRRRRVKAVAEVYKILE